MSNSITRTTTVTAGQSGGTGSPAPRIPHALSRCNGLSCLADGPTGVADDAWCPAGPEEVPERPLHGSGCTVGLAGFEPAASCSQSKRANQAALQPAEPK